MPRMLLAAVVLAAVVPAVCADGRAQTLPPPPSELARAVTLEVVARGLDHPVALAYAPGDPTGRLFVVEQAGRVRILVAGKILPTPFLDLVGRVARGGEQGLLGLAFHPHHRDNGRLFVYLTDRKGQIRLFEFHVAAGDPNRVDPASEKEILFIAHPHANHNGGELLFGPDGKLWIGTGDGGGGGDPFGNGQNRRALLGKMLRLDVDMPKPAPEIALVGLRNPWRYSFDRKTGDLYIADVGQNKFEELDVLPAGEIDGKNLGWNRMEGAHCYPKAPCDQSGLTLPVVEYSHQVGCSITGGYVYRGRALPELDGLYFYADYCSAFVRSVRVQRGRAADAWDWKRALDPGNRLAQLSTFGEDAAGELYLVSLEGVIYRFVRRP